MSWCKTSLQFTLRSVHFQSRILFLAVSLVSFCGVAYAQSSDEQPVARMITSLAPDTRNRGLTPGKASSSAGLTWENANPIERRAFEQTNAARIQNGLPPLVWDPALCRMARMHSENMARLGYFSHDEPDGLRLRDRALAVGIEHYAVLAENIAYNLGYEDPGAFAVERWMISPGHRANILYAGFRAMAIGTFVAADGSVFLSQVFLAR